MSQMFTPEEVASILKVTKETVLKWVKLGKIAHVRIENVIRIPESELAAKKAS